MTMTIVAAASPRFGTYYLTDSYHHFSKLKEELEKLRLAQSQKTGIPVHLVVSEDFSFLDRMREVGFFNAIIEGKPNGIDEINLKVSSTPIDKVLHVVNDIEHFCVNWVRKSFVKPWVKWILETDKLDLSLKDKKIICSTLLIASAIPLWFVFHAVIAPIKIPLVVISWLVAAFFGKGQRIDNALNKLTNDDDFKDRFDVTTGRLQRATS